MEEVSFIISVHSQQTLNTIPPRRKFRSLCPQVEVCLGRDGFEKLGFCIRQRANIQTIQSTDKWAVQYPNVFHGLGCAKHFIHRSTTLPDVEPQIQKARPIPVAYEENVQTEIDRMMADDIVEEVQTPEQTPWISPILVTRKKDGSIKIAVDMRKPNEANCERKFPAPEHPKKLIHSIRGAKVFSTLDLKYAFSKLTTTRTHKQHEWVYSPW